jgi:hypothetical protein
LVEVSPVHIYTEQEVSFLIGTFSFLSVATFLLLDSDKKLLMLYPYHIPIPKSDKTIGNGNSIPNNLSNLRGLKTKSNKYQKQ